VPAGPVLTVLHGPDDRPELPGARCAADAGELAAALPGTEVLLVWDAWPAVDGHLRWVHTASAGVDRLTFPGLLGSDVSLTNSRGVFDTPIAEYVLGLVLAMAKELPSTLALQREGVWRHRETQRVAGTRAVVVGGGPVGRATAALLGAVRIDVALVGRRAGPGVHAFAALDGLLTDADWLVLAAPLTPATRGLLDAERIAALPRRARVVNVGRGALVDEDALTAALAAGRIAGAALDVFVAEPLPAASPLWRLPGVVVSPHMSGDTHGWRADLLAVFLDNLDRYRRGAPLRNVVDKTLGYVTSEGTP
jgi:phosphoglycerate dehydrogenase-like enzyme